MDINPETATDEEIEAFNRAEKEKMDAKLAKQERNRAKKIEKKTAADFSGRGIEGKDRILCIATRKIGLDGGDTCEVDEEIMIPKDIAIKLQDAGAVKVKL